MPRIEKKVALFFLAAMAGAVLPAIGMFPADLPATENPTFIDTVFDNRGVIWAARLLLISTAAVLAFGGVFIVASTAIRMKNGEWLRRAGPFEISEGTASEMEGQAGFWREAALAGEEEVAELNEQLDESDEMIEQLRGVLSIERSESDF